MDLISFVFRLKNIEITIQKIIQSGPGYGPTPPHPNPFHLWIPAFTRVLCKSFSLIQPEQKKNKQRFRYFYRYIKNSSVRNLLKLFKKLLQKYLFKYGFIFGPIRERLESYACQKTCVLGSWNHVKCSDGSSPTRCFDSVRLVSIGYFF